MKSINKKDMAIYATMLPTAIAGLGLLILSIVANWLPAIIVLAVGTAASIIVVKNEYPSWIKNVIDVVASLGCGYIAYFYAPTLTVVLVALSLFGSIVGPMLIGQVSSVKALKDLDFSIEMPELPAINLELSIDSDKFMDNFRKEFDRLQSKGGKSCEK